MDTKGTGRKTGYLVMASLAGLGLLVVLISGCWQYVQFYRAAAYGVEPATDTVYDFLSAAGNGRVDEAYDYFSKSMKVKKSPQDFRLEVESNRNSFQAQDFSQISKLDLENRMLELSGTLTLQSGRMVPASFFLVLEKEKWGIEDYHIGIQRRPDSQY